MSIIQLNDPIFESWGNQAHYVTIVSALLYAGAVCFSDNPIWSDEIPSPSSKPLLFDPDWRRDGFCVTNPEVRYGSSHDACLYLDLLAAVAVVFLLRTLGKQNGMENANTLFGPNVFGIAAHGIGHGLLANALRDGNWPNTTEEIDPSSEPILGADILPKLGSFELLKGVSLFFVFWLGLLYASQIRDPIQLGTVALIAATVQVYAVPLQFAFTYVQTILLVAFSMQQLARPTKEKDFFYATFPLIVTLPLVFVGWIESTQCSAFVRQHFYGHLIYDGFIPFSLITWYVVSYIQVKKVQELTNDQVQDLNAKKKN